MKAIENSSSVVLSSETAEMIEQIFSASEMAINILDDLLNYEHMDSGTFNLDLSWSSVARFLENSFGWAMMLAAKKGFIASPNSPALTTGDLESGNSTLTYPPPRQVFETVYLHMDIYKIEQVIRNLVTNAVKFTPPDGTIKVKLSAELEANNSSKILSK
eukprot:gene35710-42238_t